MDSVPQDNILLNALGFYKPEAVKAAKDVLFEFCQIVPPKRKACQSHPDPTSAHLKDILELFERKDSENFTFPKFVADGYQAFPPSVGFDALASVMCSLRDEVAALRLEVADLRKNNERDAKSIDNVNCIIQDMAEVKTMMHEAISNRRISSASSNFPSENSRTTHRSSRNSNPNYGANADNSSNGPTTSSEDNPANRVAPQNSNDDESSQLYSSVLLRPTSGPRRTSQRSSPPAPRPSSRNPPSRNRRANATITGSRQNSSGLTSGSRVLDVFVGGCGRDTSSDNIRDYCSSNGVHIKKCETLEGKSEWSCSFKISVEASDRDKLLTGEFWPQGIVVRKFYRAKIRQ